MSYIFILVQKDRFIKIEKMEIFSDLMEGLKELEKYKYEKKNFWHLDRYVKFTNSNKYEYDKYVYYYVNGILKSN